MRRFKFFKAASSEVPSPSAVAESEATARGELREPLADGRYLINWAGITAFLLGLACLFLLLGFGFYLNEVHEAARARTGHADAIVVFSGEPNRILVATDLLKSGFGQRLLIVGQDNKDEIAMMRRERPSIFECCVEIDDKSRNTAEDALAARSLILKTRSKSVILVSSSFHVPRARKELRDALPGLEIKSHGVSIGFPQVNEVFSDHRAGSAYLEQYSKFLAAWLPGRDLVNANIRKDIFRSASDLKNVALIVAAMVALLIAVAAFSKHRRRQSPPPKCQ